MRRALHEAAATVEPSAWPAGEVLARAARRRRNQRIAVCLPVACAAVAVTAVAVLSSGADRGPGEPRPGAVPAAPAPTTRPALVTWPKVRVVAPGRAVGIGGGARMRLTAGTRCVDWNDGTGWDCRDESDRDGNQAPGSVSVQMYGYTGGTRYVLLYRGPAAPARMAVASAGRVRAAQVVTLAGNPGWAAGYLDVPGSVPPLGALASPGLTVWDQDGRVVASLADPSR